MRERAEAIEDLQQTLAFVQKAGDELGVDLYCAGTHPFAQWSSQLLTPGHRYEELIARTQWWGRQMLIWGVHVHVGVRRREHVLPIISPLLNQFPHLQALSASSPIWAGTDTGYASNRAMMFQQLPTAGLPFQFERWEEFEAFVHDQKKTGVIDHINEIRWDIRPSPHLGTVEVRVCDGIPTVRELRSIVALIHCLVVDLEERLEAGEALPTMPPWHVQENKWRAARYGLDAEIILDAECNERLVTDDLDDLLTGWSRWRCGWAVRRSWPRSRRSRGGVRRTSVSARWPRLPAVTWSPWSTPWCASSTSPDVPTLLTRSIR